MDRLVLIDGNAILHRAFHAIPPLTDPLGRPINAVYGFVTMLLRLIHDLNPSYLAVSFDRPKPTFRKTMYKDYQAKRPKMDEGLAGQIPLTHDILTSFHVPIYEMDGYEADDILGTIAKKWIGKNPPPLHGSGKGHVIIVTGDRDMLQLVEDDRVYLYMPTKGLSEGKLYGPKETKERMGVPPEKIADFKGLAGDPSDNYPGVDGIGPKTAVSLLSVFKTVESLYEAIKRRDKAIEQFSHGIIEKLRKGEDQAFLSKTLAIIKTDVPVRIDKKSMRTPEFPTDEGIAVLEQFGFYSLINRLKGKKTTAEKSEKKEKKKEEKDKYKKKDKTSEQLTLMG